MHQRSPALRIIVTAVAVLRGANYPGHQGLVFSFVADLR